VWNIPTRTGTSIVDNTFLDRPVHATGIASTCVPTAGHGDGLSIRHSRFGPRAPHYNAAPIGVRSFLLDRPETSGDRVRLQQCEGARSPTTWTPAAPGRARSAPPYGNCVGILDERNENIINYFTSSHRRPIPVASPVID
jgi:hypothetical protein